MPDETNRKSEFTEALDQVGRAVQKGVDAYIPSLEPVEVGRVGAVAQGIVWAEGLDQVRSEELVMMEPDIPGMIWDILPDRVGIIVFGPSREIRAGDEVTRTGRILDVPVGNALLGRVVDPLGAPMDAQGPVQETDRRQVLREAPPILDRAPVTTPLQTGLKAVDALIPIGRGQRELILGDRQTGKTTLAIDAIVNQTGKDVVCVYCAIGQRSAATAKVVDRLRRTDAMPNSLVVVAEGDGPPGMQYIAPYAATTMAEYFMEQGRDVLIVYDDLTRHALAYRQLSLLLRRPPGREAFPGDIFYVHSRLLERATHLKTKLGGGSLTALPIAETEAQNISAYIPTNLISITDGQIYLSPDLFQKGYLPAVDVGKSVSRVGGKAQVRAYRQITGDLRLSYTQFQELEAFSRFGTRLDEGTQKILEHGKRVRESLKQDQLSPMSAGDQIAVLLAVTRGFFDDIPLEQIAQAEMVLLEAVRSEVPDLDRAIPLARNDDPLWNRLADLMAQAMVPFRDKHADAGNLEPEDQDRP